MSKLRKYFDNEIQQKIVASEVEQCFKSPKIKKRIISINI